MDSDDSVCIDDLDCIDYPSEDDLWINEGTDERIRNNRRQVILRDLRSRIDYVSHNEESAIVLLDEVNPYCMILLSFDAWNTYQNQQTMISLRDYQTSVRFTISRTTSTFRDRENRVPRDELIVLWNTLTALNNSIALHISLIDSARFIAENRGYVDIPDITSAFRDGVEAFDFQTQFRTLRYLVRLQRNISSIYSHISTAEHAENHVLFRYDITIQENSSNRWRDIESYILILRSVILPASTFNNIHAVTFARIYIMNAEWMNYSSIENSNLLPIPNFLLDRRTLQHPNLVQNLIIRLEELQVNLRNDRFTLDEFEQEFRHIFHNTEQTTSTSRVQKRVMEDDGYLSSKIHRSE